MFSDEQELISELNSELEYSQGQADSANIEFDITSCVRYTMDKGERLDRMIVLQHSTGKLFALKPVEVTYSELTEKERVEVDERVTQWNLYCDELPKISVKK